jgi:hypothetical protein
VPASKAQQAKTAERRRQAVEMRIAGHPWEVIAKTLGYSNKGAAYTDVRRALEKNAAKLAIPVEALRELELSRLDAELVRLQEMQDALWDKVLAGDPRAIDTGLRIEEVRRRNGKQRAELLGLEAPKQVELTLESIDAAIAQVDERLAAARSEAAEATGVEEEEV